MTSRTRKRFLDCSKLTIEEAEQWGNELAQLQRDIMFWTGDLARYAEARWPDTHHQIWPEWISPGMLARASGVSAAFPKEDDRRHEATYSQYMQNAGRADRHERLESIVAQGLTTDESRQANHQDNSNGRRRWLIALDLHYFIHRHYYSGAGVETATQVAEWVQRTMERLKAKGATDCLCAFEGTGSFRRQLTEEWADHRYKGSRKPKPEDLKHQIQLARTLIEGMGFCCVDIPEHEADDVLASAARQFPGKVTIVSSDKDMRQCLSDRVNILLDVEWEEDESTGDPMPNYKWLTSDMHFQQPGILPSQWADYQTIMGDSTDDVQGVEGIGEKGAADLLKTFGTVEAAIQAAKDEDESIPQRKREALIAFEPRLAVTRKLVTLVDTCPIPANTRF